MSSNRGRGSAYKSAVATAILFLLLSSVFPLIGSETSTPVAPLQSKYLRVAVQDEPMGLNPLVMNNPWGNDIFTATYDRVVNWDWKTNKLQPWIAAGWGLDTSQPVGCEICNITVEYKLGDWENKWGGPVYFHDLVKVSIDDVLFSYGLSVYVPNPSKDITPKSFPGSSSGSGRVEPSSLFGTESLIWVRSWSDPPYGDSGFMKVKFKGAEAWLGVKKVNEHTLVFRETRPYGSFFEDTMSIRLFPKHIWGSHINLLNGTGDYLTWDMDYNSQTGKAPGLIGSGPFKFAIWMKGGYFQIDRFDNYFDWTKLPRVDDFGKRLEPEQPAYDPIWTNNHPTAYADGIIFKIYKTTESAALAIMAEPPGVDFVGWSIPPSMISDMQKNPNIGLHNTSEPGFHYLAFNMRKKPFGYEDYSGGNFTDVGTPFRKAILYSTDKDTIVRMLLQGYGKVAHGPVSPDNKEWYNDSLPAYGYNPTMAKKYLDDAGWKDTNGDGWREFPEIGDSRIDVLWAQGTDYFRFPPCYLITSSAQQIRINIQTKPMLFVELQNHLETQDFQMYCLSWKIDTSDPRYLYDLFHSSQGDALNFAGYHNATFDRLIEEAMRTSNNSKRVKLIKDAQAQIVEDAPVIPIYYKTIVEATRKDKFAGWVQEESSIYNHWSILLVRPPGQKMSVDFNGTPTKFPCSKSNDVTVHVTNGSTGSGIPSAWVRIQLLARYANLSLHENHPGDVSSDRLNVTGYTDNYGAFKVRLNTGSPSQGRENATLIANAAKEGYENATASYAIGIFCGGSHGITIDRFDVSPSPIHLGETARVSIRVVDLYGRPVEKAWVSFAVSPIGTIYPLNATTGSDGTANATISVPKDIPVNAYVIDILANAMAEINGSTEIDIRTKQLQIESMPQEQPKSPFGNMDVNITILLIVVAAVLFVLFLCISRKQLKQALGRTKGKGHAKGRSKSK